DLQVRAPQLQRHHVPASDPQRRSSDRKREAREVRVASRRAHRAFEGSTCLRRRPLQLRRKRHRQVPGGEAHHRSWHAPRLEPGDDPDAPRHAHVPERRRDARRLRRAGHRALLQPLLRPQRPHLDFGRPCRGLPRGLFGDSARGGHLLGLLHIRVGHGISLRLHVWRSNVQGPRAGVQVDDRGTARGGQPGLYLNLHLGTRRARNLGCVGFL
ncbi:hypothetical protein T484DRAFT_1891551, partial [Baffinella frigidus]